MFTCSRSSGITDLPSWLEELGLGRYSETFASNEIELRDLAHLSEEDLRELGLPMGPRKRILGAFANLEQGTLAAEATTSEPASDQARASPGGEAERRQLTVMFCDLVGSTELTQHLDPEEVREINRRYQDAAKASIERFDGFVARYMGDGVLAYFGYPRAHEDDAERAVRAGLSLLDAMGPMNAESNAPDGVELAVRVGIATGPVVVGDLIGEGASQESAVVGETPNLAARLQGLATANSVVVAGRTHDLESGHFEYEDLGDQRVKGIAEPVRAWRVIAPIASQSRFEAAHRAGFRASSDASRRSPC